MSSLPTHSHRWQHKTTAAPTRHWSADKTDETPHPGPAGEACDICHPKEQP